MPRTSFVVEPEKPAVSLQSTGTVWENYSPDAATPGEPAKPDLVGWTGIVPIVYFWFNDK